MVMIFDIIKYIFIILSMLLFPGFLFMRILFPEYRNNIYQIIAISFSLGISLYIIPLIISYIFHLQWTLFYIFFGTEILILVLILYKKRLKIFKPFQVNRELLSYANNLYIMHCLPAHRNVEITDDVIDSERSIVFHQAENRLHLQKALMLKLLNK